MRTAVVALGLLLVVASARGAEQPKYVLRLATPAPEGSGWARLMRELSMEVHKATHGEVLIRWYFGGVAGDEPTVLKRIQKGQLDGGGLTTSCMDLSPSMRVFEVAGLIEGHDEAEEVARKLHVTWESEARKEKFEPLALTTGLGNFLVFTRTPIHNLEDVRKLRLWIWRTEKVLIEQLRHAGFNLVPLELEEAMRALRDNRVDGLITIPTSAMVWQWYTEVRYFTNFRTGILPACMVVSTSSFDRLPHDYQQTIRTLAGRFSDRFTKAGRRTDESLLGGVLERNGLVALSPSPAFRAQFLSAVRNSRTYIADKLVPGILIDKVQSLLADYRSEPHK